MASENNIPDKELLELIKRDLEVRTEEIRTNRELEVKSQEYGDKENDRRYKAFLEALKFRKTKFGLTKFVFGSVIVLIFAVLALAGAMIFSGISGGTEILIAIGTAILGALGGSGYTMLQCSKKDDIE